MEHVQVQVSLPKNAAAISSALAKLVKDMVAAKKSGLTGAALVTADVTAAVSDLAGAVGAFSGIGEEAKADAQGVAEAFVIAGFDVAESLKA